MKAVILAGGLGQRLKPFTEVIPKPLLPLGEKSILEVQIQALQKSGVTEVHLATNYMSDFIEAFIGDGSKYGVSVYVSKETKPLGTCGPLNLLKDQLTDPFLVMNGDILTKLDFSEFFRSVIDRGAPLTVGTKIISTPFRFGNVEIGPDDTIVGVEEKPDFSVEIIAGIYGMTPAIFEHIPDGEYFGMDGLIKALIREKKEIGRYLIKDYWLDIGQIDDYSVAREEYASHFKQTE